MMNSAGVLTIFSFLLLVSAHSTQNAPYVDGNPHMKTYQAILQISKPIQGSLAGVSAENGTGVDFNVNFFSFPDPSIGPYIYHIHVYPVPEDGNCTATGGHLDPYNVTEAHQCLEASPETCQLGDLSGKHGKIDTTTLGTSSFQRQYLDLFLSTVEGTIAFFGNRSVVIHAANGTRLNCGNFVLQTGTLGSGNGTTNGSYASNAPTMGATRTSGNAMPSQSGNHSIKGAAVFQRWSATAILGLAIVGIAMAAL